MHTCACSFKHRCACAKILMNECICRHSHKLACTCTVSQHSHTLTLAHIFACAYNSWFHSSSRHQYSSDSQVITLIIGTFKTEYLILMTRLSFYGTRIQLNAGAFADTLSCRHKLAQLHVHSHTHTHMCINRIHFCALPL